MQWKQFKREITRTKIICQIDFKPKGQLISKSLFGIFNSPKNERKKNPLYYYGTSSRIVFICILGELKTPKRHFEIN